MHPSTTRLTIPDPILARNHNNRRYPRIPLYIRRRRIIDTHQLHIHVIVLALTPGCRAHALHSSVTAPLPRFLQSMVDWVAEPTKHHNEEEDTNEDGYDEAGIVV